MADQPKLEIPEAMRDMAERNVEQSRQAYNQFLDMARQAQSMLTKSTEAVTESAMDVQSKTMRYAEENMAANFAFVTDLARAKDLNEVMQVQQRHAQKQMLNYTHQAQDLARLMAEAAQKAGKR
jgi:phasin